MSKAPEYIDVPPMSDLDKKIADNNAEVPARVVVITDGIMDDDPAFFARLALTVRGAALAGDDVVKSGTRREVYQFFGYMIA